METLSWETNKNGIMRTQCENSPSQQWQMDQAWPSKNAKLSFSRVYVNLSVCACACAALSVCGYILLCSVHCFNATKIQQQSSFSFSRDKKYHSSVWKRSGWKTAVCLFLFIAYKLICALLSPNWTHSCIVEKITPK